MSIASRLTEEQKSLLQEWASEYIGLSGIQKRVEEQFGFRMTYMDTRFLALDLALEVREPGDDAVDEPTEDVLAEEEPLAAAAEAIPGQVSVVIDELLLPGAVVSGKVTFSDGETAAWMVDNSGRFGIEPNTTGYRPNDEDMRSFQQQLGELLRKQGF